MFINFSEDVQKDLLLGREEMFDLGHKTYDLEHLFLGFLKNNKELSQYINDNFISYSDLKQEIINLIGISTSSNYFYSYSNSMKKVLLYSMEIAKEEIMFKVSERYILISIFDNINNNLKKIFDDLNIDIDKIYNYITNIDITDKVKCKSTIELYGKNMNIYGFNDSIIERDNEINNVIEILLRKNKNNPLLLGEPGVGKTAIIEGLASRINHGDVPKSLLNKKIYSIEMASIVAGTKYRGEFEERFQKIIKEAEEDEDLILFIDEIHTVVGAGGAEGAIDASNILKPSLARGNIKLIGATTYLEYNKSISKDKALDRRFQIVLVDEIDEEKTIKVLNKLKDTYQNFYNIKITDKNIKDIVKISNRYNKNKKQPDKAIDLLDSVCAKLICKTSIKSIDKLIIDRKNAIKNNDYLLAKHIKYKENNYKLTNSFIDIKSNDIYNVIYNLYNVPFLLKNKNDVYKQFYKQLTSKIIGRDKEIELLLDKLLNYYYSINTSKPLLLSIYGKKNTGRNYFINTFAENLLGSNKVISIDLETTDINNIYNELSGVIKNPYQFIVINNYNNSSLIIKNVFTDIFNNGYYDFNGNMIYFNNCVFIIKDTENAEQLGFLKDNINSKTSIESILFKEYSKSTKFDILKHYINTLISEYDFDTIDSRFILEKIIIDDNKDLDILFNEISNNLNNLYLDNCHRKTLINNYN